MTRLVNRKKRNGPVRQGWDTLLDDPIPGDVVKCLNELGISYHRIVDDEAHGPCPKHFENTGKTDRHPSWSVNTETGEHNCFSCEFHGPFTTLVRWALDYDHDDAVAWIRARGSIERARRKLQGSYIDELVAEQPEVTEADLALYTPVPDWECDKRNLDPDSVDHYGILWDAEDELWITPIRDPDTGRLWGWQEKNRRYFRNRPDDVKKSHTLFGLRELPPDDTAILVESPLDVARLHTAGIGGGVSSFGVRVSEEQMSLLVSRVKTLIVALDNDRDGDRASHLMRKHYGHRLRMRFLNYDGTDDAKDVGDMTDEQIRHAVQTAIPSILARFS